MYYRYYAHALNRPAHFGIRSQRYKLIFYYGLSLGLKGTYTDKASKPAWEFYDLKNDPNELKNEYKIKSNCGLRIQMIQTFFLSISFCLETAAADFGFF